MPRTEEANERLRETQREKILDAARKVFAKKGWSATMADVAAAAEVSQGLAYRYFENKEAIFTAIVEKAIQSNAAILKYVKEMNGTPRERLEVLVSRMLEIRHEHTENYQLSVMTQNDTATPSHIRKILYDQGKNYIETMRDLIIEGQFTGEIAKGKPVKMAITIAACLEGLSRFALHGPEQLKKNMADVDIILRILNP